MAAVATVAALLVVIPSPWQELVAAQAVPWVPLALAWSTVRVVESSRTPRQLRALRPGRAGVRPRRRLPRARERADRGDDTGVAPVLARTVRRTVQEGLTNARRHAPGGAVTVVVTIAEDTVGVVVRNGPGTAPGHGPGTGRGLDGVRRRVALLGGDCTHAPTADGGYALRTEPPQSVRMTGTARGPS